MSSLRLFVLSIVSFAVATLLALTLPSTWPLLAVRVALICIGIALLVIGLRQRRRSSAR